MSRHTPGPWVWDGCTLKPANAAPDVSAVHSILDAEGGCGYLMSDHKATLTELDADMQLIAAAPELLVALKDLLTHDPDSLVAEVMLREPLVFSTHDPASEAVRAFERYDLVSAPVVNLHRKLAGVLCESRHRAEGTHAFVMGVGVNVSQRALDFPAELRDGATSLALAGHELDREILAAAFLSSLEPMWDEHQEGDAGVALEAWRARARFWGQPVTVRAPGGMLHGNAMSLAEDGALIVRTENGEDVRVLAGDVRSGPAWESA